MYLYSNSGAKTYGKSFRISQEDPKRLHPLDASLESKQACSFSILKLADRPNNASLRLRGSSNYLRDSEV